MTGLCLLMPYVTQIGHW